MSEFVNTPKTNQPKPSTQTEEIIEESDVSASADGAIKTMDTKTDSIMEESSDHGQMLREIMNQLKVLPSIKTSIDGLKTDVQKINSELDSIKKSLEYTQNDIDELYDISKRQDQKLGQIDHMVNELSILRSQNKKLEKKVTDLEQHSRKDNLIFEGINESKDENCVETVKHFFKTILKLETDVTLCRVHRLGPKHDSGDMKQKQQERKRDEINPRPIIAKFLFSHERQAVMDKRRQLKGSKVYIREDFPATIQQDRRRLWPIVKQARKKGHKVKQIADKILIGGKIYNMSNIDCIPNDVDIRSLSEKNTDKYLLFGGHLSPFSNYYPSKFIVGGIQYSCSEQFYQREKALASGDVIKAQEILLSNSPWQMKAIGGSVKINHKLWLAEDGPRAMRKALSAKFQQNPELHKALLATAGKSLVECNASDDVWGIGLKLDDPRADDCTTWKGKNLLGSCLDQVRSDLI